MNQVFRNRNYTKHHYPAISFLPPPINQKYLIRLDLMHYKRKILAKHSDQISCHSLSNPLTESPLPILTPVRAM